MSDDVIRVTCPNCARDLVVPARYAGLTGRCNHCNNSISLPSAPANEEEQAEGSGVNVQIANWIKILNSPIRTEEKKKEAAKALAACGESAVEALQACLYDRGAVYAARILADAGHNPFHVLLALLADGRKGSALKAAESVMLTHPRPFVEALAVARDRTQFLTENHLRFITALMTALGDSSLSPSLKIQALIMLTSADEHVRAWILGCVVQVSDVEPGVAVKAKTDFLSVAEPIIRTYELLKKADPKDVGPYEEGRVSALVEFCRVMLEQVQEKFVRNVENPRFLVPRPSGKVQCADLQCKCGTTISPGQGYLYISEKVVEYRREVRTSEAAVEKLRTTDPVVYMFAGPGVIAPMLICEQAARKRGLNLEVAAADAKRLWETGEVPLRPTPLS